MAKQEIAFANGRLGNIVFYRLNGTGYARTAPGRVKQTKATKQSAKEFGLAVQISKCLRTALSPALPNHKNRGTMLKMNAALLKWLRQEKPLKENISFVGLEFNDKSPFSEQFQKELSVDFSTKGKAIITIPQLKIPDDIVAPSNTVYVRTNIAIKRYKHKKPTPKDENSISIKIKYKNGSIAPVEQELK